jgi:hypothetical protein
MENNLSGWLTNCPQSAWNCKLAHFGQKLTSDRFRTARGVSRTLFRAMAQRQNEVAMNMPFY